MNVTIKDWLDKPPTKKRNLALKLMGIALSSDSDITADIKWGNITFSSPSGNIAWILNYKTTDYINFGFFKGAKLSDPKRLLEGTGRSLRHQKIRSEEDIDKKQIGLWMKDSMRLAKKASNGFITNHNKK